MEMHSVACRDCGRQLNFSFLSNKDNQGVMEVSRCSYCGRWDVVYFCQLLFFAGLVLNVVVYFLG